MSQKKLLLIVNPYSGKAKMKNYLLKVTEIFSSADYEVTVYPTKCRADATEKVKSLNDGDYDLIVACGGDGTLNEVITGIMYKKLDCKLGYIPSGTLNEWSQGLGISKKIPDAAKNILTGSEIHLDIGKFGDRYFSYTASFGAFTSASYSTNQDLKNVMGQAAYFFEGIKSLGLIKPFKMKFTADDRVIEGDFLFGAISNSFSLGGVLKYDKKTIALNDGLFEVILIRNPDNILKLQPTIDGLLRKEFTREGIEFFRTSKLIVETEADLSWTLDGEYAAGSEKITINNINNAINFIVPQILNTLE